MKKFLMPLFLLVILSSASYGAVSEDIYIRQDVFDAKMELLFAKIDSSIAQFDAKINSSIAQLDAKIEKLDAKIDASVAQFDTKIEKLDAKIEKLDAKIDSSVTQLDAKIDTSIAEVRGDIKVLNSRMDGFEKRMDFMSNLLYYLFVLLGALLLIPFVTRWLDNKKEREKEEKERELERARAEAEAKVQVPPFTLEDIRNLIIEEIDIRLAAKNSTQVS